MEQRINAYLDRILRWSFLTRVEKKMLREEMADHLYAIVEEGEGNGCSEQEAVEQALVRFGIESDLRKALTKETYGWTSGTIVTVSAVLAILFLFSVVCTLVQADQLLVHFILLSPSLLLTLLLCTLSLTATRKTLDRICLFLIPLPFVTAYLLEHLTLLFSLFSGASQTDVIQFQNSIYPFFTERIYSALYATSIGLQPFRMGVIGLVLLGMLLFLFCRNRIIAVLPLLLSISYTVWVIAAQSLHYAVVDAFHLQQSESFVDFYQHGFKIWIDQLDGLAVRLALAIIMLIGLRVLNHTLSNLKLKGNINRNRTWRRPI